MEHGHLLTHIKAGIQNKTNILKNEPIVELAGQTRLLIENHLGVVFYSLREIQVKVAFGKLSVIGNNLYFLQITREQLVINGQIESVTILRR